MHWAKCWSVSIAVAWYLSSQNAPFRFFLLLYSWPVWPAINWGCCTYFINTVASARWLRNFATLNRFNGFLLFLLHPNCLTFITNFHHYLWQEDEYDLKWQHSLIRSDQIVSSLWTTNSTIAADLLGILVKILSYDIDALCDKHDLVQNSIRTRHKSSTNSS